MAFFARISDTSVGGTYMTMLNTFTNLGGNWPSWIALRYVSELTWTTCLGSVSSDVSTCTTDQEKQVRMLLDLSCHVSCTFTIIILVTAIIITSIFNFFLSLNCVTSYFPAMWRRWRQLYGVDRWVLCGDCSVGYNRVSLDALGHPNYTKAPGFACFSLGSVTAQRISVSISPWTQLVV